MHKYHTFPLRVYLEDTDAGGRVYHAQCLKFTERARAELLRHLEISHTQMMQESNILFVVRSCLVNYLAPAYLDDILEVRTCLKKPGPVKVELSQSVMRDNHLIATVEVVLACVDLSGKPLKIDDRIYKVLVTYKSFMEKIG